MPTDPSQRIRTDRAELEADAERIMANPSVLEAVFTVAPAILPFVLATWALDSFLGVSWPLVPLAMLVLVYLVQSAPTDLQQGASISARVRFTIPAWTARAVLAAVLVHTYIRFLELAGPLRWIFLAVMALVVIPIMWFPLLQMRQCGILSAIGLLPVRHFPTVISIASTQVLLWTFASSRWFSNSGILTPIALTTAAAAWHLAGNALLIRLRLRAGADPAGAGSV